MIRFPVIAFTLMAAVPAAAQNPLTPTTAPLGPTSTLLSLTAEGQSRRAPDLAVLSAGVVTQGKDASEAMAENSRQMNAVVAALRRAGAAERDIQTSAISLQPRFSNPELERQLRAQRAREAYVPAAEPETPHIIGYEARNSVEVRVRKLGEMGKMIDALVQAGANQVIGPTFMLDDSRVALDEARTQAVANAQQRAELYARAAGMRVNRILSISEGGGYYPVPVSAIYGESRGYGAPPPPPPPPPVAPGEITLGMNVSVQFELTR